MVVLRSEGPFHLSRFLLGHYGVVPSRPLTRSEVVKLADRLRALLAMVDKNDLSATTGMTYRIQGAVTALDAVLGTDASLLDDFERPGPA
jgi:hypothetical protein